MRLFTNWFHAKKFLVNASRGNGRGRKHEETCREEELHCANFTVARCTTLQFLWIVRLIFSWKGKQKPGIVKESEDSVDIISSSTLSHFHWYFLHIWIVPLYNKPNIVLLDTILVNEGRIMEERECNTATEAMMVPCFHHCHNLLASKWPKDVFRSRME